MENKKIQNKVADRETGLLPCQQLCFPISHDQIVRRHKVKWASRMFQLGPFVTSHLVKNEDIWLMAKKAWSIKCFHDNITVDITLHLTWQVWFIFLLKPFVTLSIFQQKLEFLGKERRSFKDENANFVQKATS